MYETDEHPRATSGPASTSSRSLSSLAARDANSNDLEDLFDFDNSPSVNATVGTAPQPMQPPAFMPGDPGCPFS